MCKIPWKKFYIYVLYSKIVTRDVGNFFLHPDKSGLVLSVQDLKLFRQLYIKINVLQAKNKHSLIAR